MKYVYDREDLKELTTKLEDPAPRYLPGGGGLTPAQVREYLAKGMRIASGLENITSPRQIRCYHMAPKLICEDKPYGYIHRDVGVEGCDQCDRVMGVRGLDYEAGYKQAQKDMAKRLGVEE